VIEVEKNEKRLLEAALKAMGNAHVLWGCKVGAAALAEDGEIYGGCNIESWVSGLGVCAERCAINHAVLHGNRRIMKMAIVMYANSQCEPRPCGSCLQYMYDFAENPDIRIIMAKAEKDRILLETAEVKTLRKLLPYPFRT